MSVTDTATGKALRAVPRRRPWLDRWTVASFVAAALLAVPLFAVIAVAFMPTENVWGHLARTVLPTTTRNTLVLMLGVGAGVLVIGVGTAWLVTMCRFPGHRTFEWMLVLPVAMPAYVIAYVYTDLLEFAGPLQRLLRAAFGWRLASEYWFPEIRSMGGAVCMLTLVFYPYVYLLARAAFLEQSVAGLDVGRTLGRGAWRTFWSVALPLARPAIVVGLALALMETLNDFGTVEYFAITTYTLGIFNVWFGMNNVAGAAQIAVAALAVVLLLIVAERLLRRGRRFHHTGTTCQTLPRYRLAGWRAGLAFVACLLPVVLGFLLPGAVLLRHASGHIRQALADNFLVLAANSLFLAALAAGIAVGVSILMAYGTRLRRWPVLVAVNRFASVGYAIPGTVLALGVIISLGWIDRSADTLAQSAFGVSTALLLSGTVLALTYAYVARFLAVSFGAVEASFTKVTMSMDHAARTLGRGPGATLWRVHLPLIRGSALTASLLVFVEVMKELPMTLILRPFNFNTLATYVYQYASDEQLERAALAALTILAAGVVPVIMLSRAISRARPGYA